MRFAPQRFADLSFGHQFVVWAVRVWRDDTLCYGHRDMLLHEGFARLGAPQGLVPFLVMMEQVADGPAVSSAAPQRVSEDEMTLAEMIAGRVRGGPVLLANGPLAARACGPALDDLAESFRRIGLRFGPTAVRLADDAFPRQPWPLARPAAATLH